MEATNQPIDVADLLRSGRAHWQQWPARSDGNARVDDGQVVIDGRRFATRLKDGVPVVTAGMREVLG